MIVFCHLFNDRSGSPTVLRNTLDALSVCDNGILFVGSQGHGVLNEADIPIRRFWYRRSRFRIITLATYLISQFALYNALAQAKDIPKDALVFVNTLLPFGAMLWGKRTGRKVVVHVHEVSITPFPLRLFLIYVAKRCACRLLYVSSDHYARLPIHGPRISIIPNAVSPKIADAAAKHVPCKDGVFTVLMLASPRGYKGIGEFMELADSLRSDHHIVFELVLNAGRKEVQSLATQYPNAENVVILPSTEDPAKFYANADLVLNLSRVDQWIETFGLTLVEAMMFGIPVIAPPVGGPAEIISHGVEGYCIDSRDSAALKNAVTSLVYNTATYAAMSRAAMRRAQDFSFDAYSEALRAAVFNRELEAAR